MVKDKLKDERAEVRSAAARVAGAKGFRLGSELIDMLGDDEAAVRDAAHQALVQLARGADFGPSSAASREDREQAARKWREWWDKQGKR